MNITNVVLDRTNQRVTFDTADRSDCAVNVYWSEDCCVWRCLMSSQHEAEINNKICHIPRGANATVRPVESSTGKEPTPDYYNKTFKGVKLDPYRVCELYDINGGPREHIVKKLLRGINKDDGINTELDLISVVEGQLRRWKEMLKEDAE